MTESKNPYCKSCGSCGESDCCSPFQCLKKSVQLNNRCSFGEAYLKEVELYYLLGKTLYDLILEKGNMKNVRVVKNMYDGLHKKIYDE